MNTPIGDSNSEPNQNNNKNHVNRIRLIIYFIIYFTHDNECSCSFHLWLNWLTWNESGLISFSYFIHRTKWICLPLISDCYFLQLLHTIHMLSCIHRSSSQFVEQTMSNLQWAVAFMWMIVYFEMEQVLLRSEHTRKPNIEAETQCQL